MSILRTPVSQASRTIRISAFFRDRILRVFHCDGCGYLLSSPAYPCPLCSSNDNHFEANQGPPHQDPNQPADEFLFDDSDVERSEAHQGIVADRSVLPYNNQATIGYHNGWVGSHAETINPMYLVGTETVATSSINQLPLTSARSKSAYVPFRVFNEEWSEISQKPDWEGPRKKREHPQRKWGTACGECKSRKKRCDHPDAEGPPGGGTGVSAPSLISRSFGSVQHQLHLMLGYLRQFLRRLPWLRYPRPAAKNHLVIMEIPRYTLVDCEEFSLLPLLEIKPLRPHLWTFCKELDQDMFDLALVHSGCGKRTFWPRRLPTIPRIDGLTSHGRGAWWTTLCAALFTRGGCGLL
ncbi:hypothetical protein K469DRAFT_707631 [Zopfia rhizophila CBS 207.26]|uniref:Uncharacterized protein n=1 Tax=Zopfia rhizophila CBS 207.26 TaxID=1314779 RepID=A0A6A6E5B3_9PEZI|nr:hypothetical protein K469DRAFT_707631 [Zopfia rhizophila CBS 207.26]